MIRKIYKLRAIWLMKHGDHILIKPTMRCNLQCDYCIVTKTTGHRPIFKECDVKTWLELLNLRKPKIVTISGGEPMMYKEIEKIINYLTSQKIYVTISTNLMLLNLEIKPSRYLWLYATNHKTNTKLFKRNYYIYITNGYNVSVSEFGSREIKGSKLKELKDKQTNQKVEIYAPDTRKFNGWIEMEKHGK